MIEFSQTIAVIAENHQHEVVAVEDLFIKGTF